jgi:phosphoribosylformylglycinamidine cyclo-ligase
MAKDLAQQDAASAIAYRWAEGTFAHRPPGRGSIVPLSGAQFSTVLDVAGKRIAVTSDGIGTKVELAERMGVYDTLGFDLVAMVVDDLAANGSEPFALTNVLDVDRVDAGTVDALMRGLSRAASAAQVAVTGGEIAELGTRVGGFGEGMHFNWSATALGLLDEGVAAIDGRGIQVGDEVIALRCTNLRSNGFSRARKALEPLGAHWHEHGFQGQPWGAWLLSPCEIYSPFVTGLRAAGLHPRGLAHITGGGLPSKLGRTLRATGLGAELADLFAPPDFVAELVGRAGLSAEEAYRYFNMGSGFMVVVAPDQRDATLACLAALGADAQRAGHIIAEPQLRLRSQVGDRGWLSYPVEKQGPAATQEQP